MRARTFPEIKKGPACPIAKQGVAIIASIAMGLQPTFAYANPQSGVVSAGQATITQSGNTLDVNQTSNKAVIDWRGFDIAPGEMTQFFQPSPRHRAQPRQQQQRQQHPGNAAGQRQRHHHQPERRGVRQRGDGGRQRAGGDYR